MFCFWLGFISSRKCGFSTFESFPDALHVWIIYLQFGGKMVTFKGKYKYIFPTFGVHLGFNWQHLQTSHFWDPRPKTKSIKQIPSIFGWTSSWNSSLPLKKKQKTPHTGFSTKKITEMSLRPPPRKTRKISRFNNPLTFYVREATVTTTCFLSGRWFTLNAKRRCGRPTLQLNSNLFATKEDRGMGRFTAYRTIHRIHGMIVYLPTWMVDFYGKIW